MMGARIPISESSAVFGLVRLFALALLLPATVAAATSSIEDYSSRLEKAVKLSEGLHNMILGGERGQMVDAYIAETLRGLRTAVPEKEVVAIGGAEVEVSNRWLKARLDEFERESSWQKRAPIMLEVHERLAAIAHKIGGEPGRETRSKDEDKQKLAEVLSREEYQKPQEKKESLIESWINRFLKWLDEFAPRPAQSGSPPSDVGSLATLLQALVYAAVIGVIAFTLYKFGPVIARRMKTGDPDGLGDRVILGEKIDADLSARDLMAEAESIARSGDVRGAIRKGYIAFLCELHDREAISLSRHKTNRDILRDVGKRPALFGRLKRLTGRFERHWYGFRKADISDWERFREDYNEAIKEV